MSENIVFFHSPNTRSTGTRILLEELGAPHELRVVNMKAGEQRKPAFLAVNPMGKVPAILHRGELVTEQPAIYLYLADLFPRAELAPATDDVVCFEPMTAPTDALRHDPPALAPGESFSARFAVTVAA